MFNGSVGALAGDKALKAKTGETIRLFVGNGGPNLISSFHVIGEIFDNVNTEGGVLANQKQVQTTLVPAGGSAIATFKVEVPSTLLLVDHSIFRTFNKGALGMLKVEGKENTEVYSGKQSDLVYLPEGAKIQTVGSTAPTAPTNLTKEQKIAGGKLIFDQICSACHQPNGMGLPGAFPPIAKSDYLMADKKRAIGLVLNGLSGEITVNGTKHNGVMPAVKLTDDETANVLTYVMNNFGNPGGEVSPLEVADVRAGH